MSERERLQSELATYLSGSRYRHSLNVAAAAVELARQYAPELEEQAEIAGLLHDNAKKMPADELMRELSRFDIDASPEELAMPKLLHGKVGAALLPERFGVSDRQIAEACTDHVTGSVGMGMLSRIVYVADQIAADRDFAGVEELRELARRDFGQALLRVAQNKLRQSLEAGALVEPKTMHFYNSLVLELGGQER